MKRLRSISAIKTDSWQAISKYIRARDKRCVSCKKGLADHCGHFQRNSERNANLGGNALWYDERNLNGQCFYCNHHMSGNLVSYAIYLQAKYHPAIASELYQLWLKPKKWTRTEIENIATYYKKKLLEL